jgi:hypothetical protein
LEELSRIERERGVSSDQKEPEGNLIFTTIQEVPEEDMKSSIAYSDKVKQDSAYDVKRNDSSTL